MGSYVDKYYGEIKRLIDSVEVTGKKYGKQDFHEWIRQAAGFVRKCTSSGGKLIFIGNGASAAISSHLATDYWKNGGMRAMAFNDAALLTCVSNDIGYKYVFEKSVEMFADKKDILVAISSSGKSENVLRGVGAARKKGCGVITLSGFKPGNPLRRTGDINFYVPSGQYGHVEILHHSICHCALEYILEGAKK